MCDSVYEEKLPCDTVNHLFKSRDSIHVTTAIVNENVSVNECGDNSVVDDNNTMKIVDTVNDDDLQVRRANAETLKLEQLSDESLTDCWALASRIMVTTLYMTDCYTIVTMLWVKPYLNCVCQLDVELRF